MPTHYGKMSGGMKSGMMKKGMMKPGMMTSSKPCCSATKMGTPMQAKKGM